MIKTKINPAYEAFEPWIERIPATFGTEGTTIHDGRNMVKLMTAPDGSIVAVKRYKRPNFVQRIVYSYISPGKSERAYRYGLEFLSKGINTPESIADIRVYDGRTLTDSYYVCKYTDYESLVEELRDKEVYDSELVEALTRFLIEMHDAGILHGDLNLNNIRYKRNSDGTFDFCVIDTNRSKIVKKLTDRQMISNLTRLTHRGALVRDVARCYARQRGWDEAQTEAQLMKKVLAFERHLHRKRALKKVIKSLRF